MKKIVFVLFLLIVNIFAKDINIAVAANVSYAIDELKTQFSKLYPNIKVRSTLGSSGKLTAQIINGGPYGLFMSADLNYPQALYNKKIAITKPRVYAKGTLAYLSTKRYDFSKGIQLLKQNSIKRIAIANPKTAPYGKATVEALKNAKIYKDIKSKFVYAESISQTVSYAIVAADIGIVAKASLFAPKMSKYKQHINWESVDTKLYSPIKQGIVLLKYSKNSKDYRAFYNFILSDKAKKIFKKYGYNIQ